MQKTFSGEIATDIDTLCTYAKDASSFTLTPKAIYYPKSVDDIVALIEKTNEDRKQGGSAALTMRAGGTCMSGGPLTTEWVIDMTRHMKNVIIDPVAMTASVEMGAYFRDIEDEAAKHGLMFAAYPSSHRICGIGGMIGNNASGEKSLRCGATSDNVLELEVVYADGTKATIGPKKISDLHDAKESALYELYKQYGDKMRAATGNVKKSASGYRLEKLVSGDVFNAIPLFVGAQGTLGIVTNATLRLTRIPAHLSLLAISAHSLEDLPNIITTIFEYNPEGLETFDINTFNKAKEYLPEHAARFSPYIRTENAHLFILAQFSEPTQVETGMKAESCRIALEQKGFYVRPIEAKEDVDSAWHIRRNSFLLMRDYNQEGHRAVPCIEDVIVPLPQLGTFIAELLEILGKHTVHYGFHGHIGDGSLRVIPIFDFTSPNISSEIQALMKEVFEVVKQLKGNISADHSDGIIRSPFLRDFYGDELYEMFEKVKRIYDPENIMNPNKKVGATAALINVCLDC